MSQPDYAASLPACAARMSSEMGFVNAFYSGFIPILFKQIPYTMAKFAVQGKAAEAIYGSMGSSPDKMSKGGQARAAPAFSRQFSERALVVFGQPHEAKVGIEPVPQGHVPLTSPALYHLVDLRLHVSLKLAIIRPRRRVCSHTLCSRYGPGCRPVRGTMHH